MNAANEAQSALPAMPAEARVKLTLGAQFVEIQVLQDQVATLQRQLEDTTGRLAKREAEYQAEVVDVTNKIVEREARIVELERQLAQRPPG